MKIKARLLMILLLFVFGIMVYAAPKGEVSTEYFEFDASKMDVGNMYHYVASDIDGNNLMDTFVYVKSQDTLVICKDYKAIRPGAGVLFAVEWTLDWDHMMFCRGFAYNPLKDLSFPNQDIKTLGEADYEGKKLNIVCEVNDKRGDRKKYTVIVNYEKEPVYDYSLFNIDLLFALRHLRKEMEYAVVGNNYWGRCADMKISYMGDEMIDDVMCRKFGHRTQGVLPGF